MVQRSIKRAGMWTAFSAGRILLRTDPFDAGSLGYAVHDMMTLGGRENDRSGAINRHRDG